MTVDQFIAQATLAFQKAGIATARLDAHVLLAAVLRQNRAWILAHGDTELSDQQIATLTAYMDRRTQREPIAYMLGRQEFYGRNFTVTPDVLIPRPETEIIIEIVRALPLPDQPKICDVGTGSGAIAITLALEMPHAQIAACDISREALAIAEQNAERLHGQVNFFTSELLSAATMYNLITANLPYVATNWERSPETNFEPALALFADDNGLALIARLIQQAPNHLAQRGYLLLEADPRQHAAIIDIAQQFGFALVKQQGFIVALQLRDDLGTRTTPIIALTN